MNLASKFVRNAGAPRSRAEVGNDRPMSIRSKMLAAFLVALLLVIALVLTAIRMELSTIRVAAALEAQHIADSIARVEFDGSDGDTAKLQKYVEQIGRRYDRDVVVVDRARKGIADADPSEIGGYFTHDENGEVSATIADGHARVFQEKNDRHPGGIMQIVLPLRQASDGDSPIVGAVILEYTRIYDALMAAARDTLIFMSALGAGAVILLLYTGSRLSNGIGRRLKGLEAGVALVTAGGSRAKVPERPRDEIGKLGAAFNKMNDELRRADEALSKHRESLEARVVERLAAGDR